MPDTIVTSLLVVGDQLIAGTDLGAFISNDLEGSDWAVMGDLPAIAVNQLVQDPADPNRIFAATYGRGVWTYELTGKSAVAASKQGRGLLIGALSPALLLLLGFGLALRRRMGFRNCSQRRGQPRP